MSAAPDLPPRLAVPTGIPELLRDLLHERTGVFFETSRLDLLLDKLSERVRAHGQRSFLEYFYLLKYEAGGAAEWLRVMDALSVPETYFWREAAQIEALTRLLAPQWFERSAQPLRIWSAACATGEEPYSLGIALVEAGFGGHPIRIAATDASEAQLARARDALYRERSFRTLSPALRAKYFEPAEGGWTRLRKELLPPVEFHRANLVEPAEVAPHASAAVIFCRNVFIYFSPEAIRRSVEAFAAGQAAGSHLFVGASESLLKLTQAYDLQQLGEALVYVRRAASVR